MPDYYYILMSQRDMTQSQVLEEILRERANYYFSKNKPLDFWLTISPSFIKDLGIDKKVIKTNFYNQHQPDIHVYPDMAFYGCLISIIERSCDDPCIMILHGFQILFTYFHGKTM